MINTIRISAALILIVCAGLVHGAWTNRWGSSPALAALASRIDSIPMVIGDWKATARELTPDERAMTGAVGSFSRVYTNTGRGLSVSVLLLGGLPGKISTHTPDVCYTGAGFILGSSSLYDYRYESDGQRRAQFQTAVATRGGTNPSILRIFWGWNASKGWAAPSEPRWTYGSEPALCKLYVIRETAGAVVDPGADPCNEFLKVFLPEVDRLVFSTSK
jgi:Protein of unknown function (DUF3485)